MTNTTLLKALLKKSGFKLEFIANCMGITRQTLSRKVNNYGSFNQYEIASLCKLLGLKKWSDIETIFFADEVDKNAYKEGGR